MKFNWGTGILMVIIIFLILIISFVLFTCTHKVNLVEEDYYPKELNFDSQIEKNSNTEALEEKIRFIVNDGGVIIAFPKFVMEGQVEGTILVYRPSDYDEDKKFIIEVDENAHQYIPTGDLLPGKYIFKVDWTFNGINYFQEEVINN